MTMLERKTKKDILNLKEDQKEGAVNVTRN